MWCPSWARTEKPDWLLKKQAFRIPYCAPGAINDSLTHFGTRWSQEN
jgi:hypothetical protein